MLNYAVLFVFNGTMYYMVLYILYICVSRIRGRFESVKILYRYFLTKNYYLQPLDL